jgi:hypothetical protein
LRKHENREFLRCGEKEAKAKAEGTEGCMEMISKRATSTKFLFKNPWPRYASPLPMQ